MIKRSITTRTLEDVTSAVNKQLKFLKTSSALFDQGDLDEAVRIALAIRVLLHDTPKSTSLLTQLGIKSSLKLVDTEWTVSDEIDRIELTIPPHIREEMRSSGEFVIPIFGEGGLIIRSAGANGPAYAAPLDSRATNKEKIAFEYWWTASNAIAALLSSGEERFSRRDLIMYMANKDGGAHFDAEIDERYLNLLKQGVGHKWAPGIDLTMAASDDPRWRYFDGNAAACAVRQIAFEVLKTFSNGIERMSGEH